MKKEQPICHVCNMSFNDVLEVTKLEKELKRLEYKLRDIGLIAFSLDNPMAFPHVKQATPSIMNRNKVDKIKEIIESD